MIGLSSMPLLDRDMIAMQYKKFQPVFFCPRQSNPNSSCMFLVFECLGKVIVHVNLSLP